MISRERVFEIIEKYDGDDMLSKAYDFFMIGVIVVSLIPLAFKRENTFFYVLDKVCVAVFIVDYLFRWLTADYKFGKFTPVSFIRYPVSPMAIVDLISILPSLSFLSSGFKLLRVLRMIRAMRVFRVFKAMRYSRSFEIIGNVIRSSRDSLIAVCALAGGYILVSALVIFNVEPDSFATFFDAVYWATVSLTTVGYGDIYPVSTFGRIITMASSIFGIAIVALPAGIITAGYMNELNRKQSLEKEQEAERDEE
ncbi:MAG: ion transporter [Oscillospiraceae bacterium]|nr:ion transporter [Oscillospiraceae bacterium]